MTKMALSAKYFVGPLLLLSQIAHASELAHSAITHADIERLKFITAGNVVLGKRVLDSLGEHILVLTEKWIRSANGRIERIELAAAYYDRAGGKWIANWVIRDGVHCPGLDSAASFFPHATKITDLDGDGRAEVTVAYKTFCGGGIDPSTVKVILRQGKQKFAIRGESLIKFKGQEPMGGTYNADKALLATDNEEFRRHMEKVWQQVYVERNDG